MATLEDVRRLALALPEVTEGTRWRNATWFIGKAGFVWERPLSKNDARQLAELGQPLPDGELLAVKLPSVGEREALLAEDPALWLTIPHFADYAAVLLRLEAVELDELAEIIEDAWLEFAPEQLAADFLAGKDD
ncbi:MAG: MmcQ/YjbR family DNA-binding protein [Patulibacter minatonensis]